MATETETITADTQPSTVLQNAVIEKANKLINIEPIKVQELMKILVEQSMKGTLVWEKNLTNTINKAINRINELVSKQISEIIHQPEFQKLEGTWRGLLYLVKNTLTGSDLKIRLLDIDKENLFKNFDKAIEFDQSDLFKKVYEEEYGTAGGEPYSVLIGDYEFRNHPQDIKLLRYISEVASAAFSPFIAQAAPDLMGLKTWEDLSKPNNLANIFNSPEYASWNNFRSSEESRFITLTLPRVLARLPYGENTVPVEGFKYEEVELTSTGQSKKNSHDHYCWMNASYVHGAVITRAFTEYGWCTAIRGVENGGKVDDLNVHVFLSDNGDVDMNCPTEVGITDRREAELSNLGFLPLSHYKNEAYAVFFGGQTANLPNKYDDADANANAEIASRLPYILATSRVAHYLKVIARDKIGSFMELSNVEKWLNDWILNYVNSNPASGQSLKARYPFADAKIKVEEVLGRPGSYNAVAWLRPWLQLEELTTSLRLVARIPE